MSLLPKFTALYFSPSDYPNKWVARHWRTDGATGKAVADVRCQVFDHQPVGNEIEGLDPGAVFFDRLPQDDPVVVGVWL